MLGMPLAAKRLDARWGGAGDSLSANPTRGGDEGSRTPDLYVANVPLSPLSYIPTYLGLENSTTY